MERTCWIFDLDGTLTVAAHDFDAIRRDLGLRPNEPILEQLAELPPAEAAPLREQLADIEGEIADRSEPQPGAARLLEALADRGHRRGILTRNRRDLAWRSLRAAGLEHFFSDGDVLGRTDAAPKPSPDGLLKLLDRWAAPAGDGVFVGDYLFDLQAGRRAGLATVHFDVHGAFRWSEHADREVRTLGELLPPSGSQDGPTS
ncbi:MAG: HAD family hydrolase [Proteobacteria bacterium]|nr:HAD family hydrolase [Pseudomonadota bacterium]